MIFTSLKNTLASLLLTLFSPTKLFIKSQSTLSFLFASKIIFDSVYASTESKSFYQPTANHIIHNINIFFNTLDKKDVRCQ